MTTTHLTKREFQKAADRVTAALLDVKGLLPHVDEVSPYTGETHHVVCREWTDVYYGDGALNAKKWAAFVNVAPLVAAQVQPLVDAALTAKAEYKVARDADKVAKADRAAARAEISEYKAKHGARPLELPNCNAAANYDVLSAALGHVRSAFIDRVIELAVEAAIKDGKAANVTAVRQSAEAEFDSYVAKLASKITDRIHSVENLEGSLWYGSVLTVETSAGRQIWNTGCKHNARYGYNSRNGRYTPYIQWPTKRVA